MTRAAWRFRLAATCTALTALAFVQSPGLVAADTKLDLTQDPWGFLGRALHLWDDQGFFGQLQNQAYGYLFPMGPFFGAAHSLGVPDWVTQRLWWSLLLCVAFLGTVRLGRLVGLSSPAARWVAALAFALAPRVVTTLGPISSETLVVALAPWVLIPLVAGAQGRLGARRAAALSGVALLLAGGVNAVATGAALVLPALYLLTRAPGAARRRLVGWWALCTVLAALWWTLPLLVLGRYSPPFLDWIESASVTTGRADVATAARGTTDWVAYVGGAGGPTWPAGWQLVSGSLLVLLTGLVAALGLAGLSQVRAERRFLLAGLLVGLVLLTLGHTGPVQGVAAGGLQGLLDGVLAPLRNTHKFDLVVRLPLALGVGAAVMALRARATSVRQTGSWARTSRAVVPALAASLVLAAAWPALTGALTRDRTFSELPAYWREVADFLAAEDTGGTALVVPGAPFGTYLWGRPQDEPLQVLASTRWGVRDAVPLSSAGNTRLLDEVGQRLATGRGSAGLAEALARSGVRWLVVRNDLDVVRSQAPRSVLVHEALDASPGIAFARGFGPPLVPFGTDRLVIDARLDSTYPAVELYEVAPGEDPADPRAVLRPATSVLSAPSTGADGLPALADAGLLDGRASVLGRVAPEGVGVVPVVTDTYRRAEVDFGRVTDNRGGTMQPGQAWQADRRVHDHDPGPDAVPATASVEGVASVTASSSQSQIGTLDGSIPGAAPAAALDLDLVTAWQVRDAKVRQGSWWEARFSDPRDVTGLRVVLLPDPITGETPDRLVVVTDTGRAETELAAGADPQVLSVPDGATSQLRIELPGARDPSTRVLGLREVLVPQLLVGAPLTVPVGDASGGLVLTARSGARDGCVTVPLRFPCASALPRPGEDTTAIDRLVELTTGGTYELDVLVRRRPDAGAGRLLDPVVPSVRAAASSVLVGDPRSRPQAAVDRDPSTAWIAGVGDTRPTLTLELPEERVVSGLQLQIEPDVAASRPLVVTVAYGGRRVEAVVDSTGAVRLPPTRTSRVAITFGGTTPLRSFDLQRGTASQLPVGVSEVLLRGALDLGRTVPRGTPTGVACGFGPVLEVDGAPAAQTRVVTTVGAMLAGVPVAATTCGGPVALQAGTHRIRVRSTSELSVLSVTFVPVGAPRGATVVPATITRWGPTDRELQVPPAPEGRLLELAENANRGWTATTADGTVLEPLVVDGWRQAFVVPAGVGGAVTLAFAPDRAYRAGLLTGAAAVLLLLALALVPARRGVAVPSRSAARVATPLPLSAAATLGAGVAVAAGWALPAALVGALAARSRLRPFLVAGLGSAAAAVAALAPWPGSAETTWPGATASVLALAAVAGATWPARWPVIRPRLRSVHDAPQA